MFQFSSDETSPKKRVGVGDVANILTLISNPPNRRDHPLEGDMKGDFQTWFDGGAMRVVTGYTVYYFIDGTRVTVHTLHRLLVSIEFANGESVNVEQEEYRK